MSIIAKNTKPISHGSNFSQQVSNPTEFIKNPHFPKIKPPLGDQNTHNQKIASKGN